MACQHKFQKDLIPDLDFNPETLILGTFNPEFPKSNKAEWFYGRLENNFWDVLPRLYNEKSLRCKSVSDWKSFCKKHKIVISDLIECIKDADENNLEHLRLLSNFSDKNISESFYEHTFTDINRLLMKYTSIKYVYLTRGLGDTFWKKAWNSIISNVDTNKKIVFKTLITPSGYARFQQGVYNKKNPQETLSIEDYILMRWEKEWHALKTSSK